MSKITDFLFGASSPPNVTTTGQSTTALPQWYQDYTQQLLARSALQGLEGYQTYGGPRIAGLNADQQQAFNTIRGNAGQYRPAVDSAVQNLFDAGNIDIQGAASPYMDAASRSMPEGISDYLNPYTENVTNRSRDLAMRTWNEDIMPSISDIFVRGGTYASSNMADKLIRGGRDVAEGLQDQSNALLADAYRDSGNQFASDASRQAQLAQLAGGMAGDQGNLLLNSARAGGDLATMVQNLGMRDAAALESIGDKQQAQTQKNLDLAYQDFQDQRDYPVQQLQMMRDMLSGINTGETRYETDRGPLPGAEYGRSGLEQMAGGAAAVKGIWDLIKDWG